MTFTNEGTVILETSDGMLTINDVTYNYTQDAFVIMGDLEFGMGCDIFIAFNLEGFVAGSEECDFLFGAEAGADADYDLVSDVLIGVDADADTDDDGATDDAAVMMDDDGSDDGDDGLTAPCTTLAEWCAMGGPIDIEGISFEIFCGLLPIADPDEAFVDLYALLDTAGVEIDDSLIPEIIMFHFAEGLITTEDLECGGEIEMMAGGDSRTKCGNMDDGSGIIYHIQKGGGNRKNDIEPYIIGPDITGGGCTPYVMHVVDQVMLPNFVDPVM